MRVFRSTLAATVTSATLLASVGPVASQSAATETVPPELMVAQPAAAKKSGSIKGLGRALREKPIIYDNGCHQWRPSKNPVACIYGHTKKPRGTVILFGDSHAAHWFNVVNTAAKRQKWKMLSVTKSSCPANSLFVRRYRQHQPYGECKAWRQRVFRKLANGELGTVDAVVMSSWDFHQVLDRNKRVLTGKSRAAEWQAGTEATLRRLTKHVKTVYVLRDSPQLPGGTLGFQRCVRGNVNNPARCGTTVKRAFPSAVQSRNSKRGAHRPWTGQASCARTDSATQLSIVACSSKTTITWRNRLPNPGGRAEWQYYSPRLPSLARTAAGLRRVRRCTGNVRRLQLRR